jgi:hypothetical protein
MSKTIIMQMFVGDDHLVYTRILYPDDYEPGEEKVSLSPQAKDELLAFFHSTKVHEKSILIEATLTKTRKSNRMHYESILHILNTTESPVVEFMQLADPEELSIIVWENDQRAKFIECLKTMSKHDFIDVSKSEVQCSTGICVAKVDSVNLRSGKNKPKGK